MKPFLIILISLLTTLVSFGQQAEYPDSGFTNKAEAKNIIINGLKEGKWVEYVDFVNKTTSYEKAVFYELVVYKAGKPSGIERIYSMNGKLTEEVPYSNGQKNGIERSYDTLGHLYDELPLVNGEISGLEKCYYPSGKIMRETYLAHSRMNGTEKIYYENGKLKGIGTYSDEYPIGEEKKYYESGKLKDVRLYANGMANGVEKVYYENGKIKYEMPYTNNKWNGLVKRYNENGKLDTETPYTNDTINGVVKTYYDNGKLFSETPYYNGKMGKRKTYDLHGIEINDWIKDGKLEVHQWVSGSWFKLYTDQIDSTEIIHEMLIGTWIDSIYSDIGMIGSCLVERKVFKDSIITTRRWRASEYYHLEPMDSAEYVKFKNTKRDTSLQISVQKYLYKIIYFDELKNNANFKGYSIAIPSPDGSYIDSENMDDFETVDIVSIADKKLIVGGGIWCPCVNVPTETYKKK